MLLLCLSSDLRIFPNSALGKTVKNLREGLSDGSKEKEAAETEEAEVVEEAPKKRVVKKVVEVEEEEGDAGTAQK